VVKGGTKRGKNEHQGEFHQTVHGRMKKQIARPGNVRGGYHGSEKEDLTGSGLRRTVGTD